MGSTLCATWLALVHFAAGPYDSTHVRDALLPPTVSRPRPMGRTVDTIVLHFSSDAVTHPRDPYVLVRVLELYLEHGVSAHYVIDRAGIVYRLVDEGRVAFHAGRGQWPGTPDRRDRLNDYSIGIELLAIGSERDMANLMTSQHYKKIAPSDIGYTDRQYESLRRLVHDIRSRHGAIALDRKHIIGHDEYARGRKSDPGELFDWSRLDLSP